MPVQRVSKTAHNTNFRVRKITVFTRITETALVNQSWRTVYCKFLVCNSNISEEIEVLYFVTLNRLYAASRILCLESTMKIRT
jgi:hypothetical protein